MRFRPIVLTIALAATVIMAIAVACSSVASQPAPTVTPTKASTHVVTIFPGAALTPTPNTASSLHVVRPILPTVPPNQRPTPTPQRGHPPTPELGTVEVPRALRHTENLLVLGSDQRKPGQPWRTDVIMVVAIDRERNRIGVVSIPRDLWVKIPGVGWGRINTADFYGSRRKDEKGKPMNGAELVKETLRQNMGIPIHHYVRVDFNVFKGVIDALGGITITVDCPLVDPHWREGGKPWRLEPGEHLLNGEEALRYVRSRYMSNDLDRARRQQRVLLAIRDRALEVNLWPRIPALYREFHSKVATDLGPLDVLDLVRFGMGLKEQDIHGLVINRPMVQDWITPGGAMVLVPDYQKIRQALDTLFDTPPLSKGTDRTGRCP